MDLIDFEQGLPVTFVSRGDGLAGSQVHDVAVDHDSVLWTAGSAGLARYDGTLLTNFGRHQGLTSHGLRSVSIGSDRRVWIGGDAGVDVMERDGSIASSLSPEADWKWGIADVIAAHADGRVLVGTGFGLIIGDGRGGWQPTDDLVIGDSLIRDIAIAGDGAVWATGPRFGLARRDHATWTHIDIGDGIVIDEVRAIAQSSSDGLMLVAGNGGVAEVDVLGRVRRSIDDPELHGARHVLQIGVTLWVAVRGRLLELVETADSWRIVGSYLRGTSINALVADEFGNVWAATEGRGLAKISTLRDAVTAPNLGKAGGVLSIRPASTGELLIGRDGLSCRVTLGDDPVVATISGLENLAVWDLRQAYDGRLWAATNVGVLRRDGTDILAANTTGAVSGDPARTWTRVAPDSRVLAAQGRALLERADGMWIGTLAGLAVATDDGVSEVLGRSGQSLGYVYTLAEADDGRLWVGTLGSGLWVETDDRTTMERVVGAGLTPTGNTYGISQTAAGDMLVTQDDRVVRIDPTMRSDLLWESADPVAGWTVLALGDDIWVGTSAALSRHDLDSGELGCQIACFLGAAGWEFTTSRTLVQHTDGRLLCGTTAGLLIVDPAHLPDPRERPKLAVAEIVWTNAMPSQSDSTIVVPEGKWTLRVDTYSPWRYDETDLRFRFRLLGFDDDWSTPGPEALVRFNSLPPGNYTLIGQCFSPLVGWGSTTELVDLRVESDSGLLGRLAATALRERWRMRRLRDLNLELEQRVRDRTMVLTETQAELEYLNAQLTDLAITDPVTGIHNRRHFDEKLESEWERARRHRSAVGLLMVDIDLFKWLNDDLGHQAGDECLESIASLLERSMRDQTDAVARYGGEEFGLILVEPTEAGLIDSAERVCQTVRDARLPNPRGIGGIVTVSVGAGLLRPSPSRLDGGTPEADAVDPTWQDLVRLADGALYQAKRAGRDQVVIAGSPDTR